VEDVHELFDSLDFDKNGTLSYTEFLSSILDQSIYCQEEKLRQSFNVFDKDGSGFITQSELRQFLLD